MAGSGDRKVQRSGSISFRFAFAVCLLGVCSAGLIIVEVVMSFSKRAIAASIGLALASSSAMAAGEAVRPNMSVSAPGTRLALPMPRAGVRVGRPVKQENNLLGAPLFLAFLGAVVITISTIIIVNNGNNPGSP